MILRPEGCEGRVPKGPHPIERNSTAPTFNGFSCVVKESRRLPGAKLGEFGPHRPF